MRLKFVANAVNKLSSLSLSDNTVQRRIEEMSEDINTKWRSKLNSHQFKFHNWTSQQVFLLVLSLWYMYVISTIVISMKSRFSIGYLSPNTWPWDRCFKKVDTVFACEDFDWLKVDVVCTDGAPSMLGTHSGF